MSEEHWDDRYREAKHLSIWPWTDLVSHVMRLGRGDMSELRVLELGCGAGANIKFFRRLGVQYHAIEGSPHIVERLSNAYPELRGRLAVGDFTQDIPFDGNFDLVIDRAALTHNSTEAIERCLGNVHERMPTGAHFIGIDWFATDHQEFESGEPGADEYTRSGYTTGPFAGVGQVHFSDRAHLTGLFEQFRIQSLEKKVVERELPDPWRQSMWNIVAAKN